MQKDTSMASTNLQTFFNNPSTSRDYTTVSSGLRSNTNAIERIPDKDATDNLRFDRSKEGNNIANVLLIQLNWLTSASVQQ